MQIFLSQNFSLFQCPKLLMQLQPKINILKQNTVHIKTNQLVRHNRSSFTILNTSVNLLVLSFTAPVGNCLIFPATVQGRGANFEIFNTSGFISLTRRNASSKSSTECPLFISFNTFSEPACTGTCKNFITFSFLKTSTSSSSTETIWRGFVIPTRTLKPLGIFTTSFNKETSSDFLPRSRPYAPLSCDVKYIFLIPEETARSTSALISSTGKLFTKPCDNLVIQKKQQSAHP